MSPRIVSLLASGTEIVDAIGLSDHLVAISHECDHPEHVLDLPRASRTRFDPEGLSSGEIDAAVRDAMLEHGSVYALDADLIASLDPDIVLTQAVCEVCAVPTAGVRETLAERDLGAEVVSLDAHTIDDILASVTQVGEAAARHANGQGAASEGRAEATVEALRTRLDAVREAVAGAPRPRVLGIEWLDPPFAPGHWVPEMVEWAGAENLIGDAGKPSRQCEWDELSGLDPDVLLIMPCGYAIEAARADADANAQALVKLAPRAVEEGRAFVVDASAYFNRSGPRFVTGVEVLAALLHPDRLPAPSPVDGAIWTPPETT